LFSVFHFLVATCTQSIPHDNCLIISNFIGDLDVSHSQILTYTHSDLGK